MLRAALACTSAPEPSLAGWGVQAPFVGQYGTHVPSSWAGPEAHMLMVWDQVSLTL